MKYVCNPPDACALMTSARSFGSYDLAAALADLIDNSISARARNIHIRCLYNEGNPVVRVIDDGEGMEKAVLVLAMRPASVNPAKERSPDDLGRFGWGLKSASFSQCTRLTVISRHAGVTSGAVWDLNDIDNWRMGVMSDSDIMHTASPEVLEQDGTEVIWEKCDRLSEDRSLSRPEFNDLIAHAGSRLALVFHRYMSGEAVRRSLSIWVNNQLLEPFDPFHRNHNATQPLEVEQLKVGGDMVRIAPYVLPHYSKLSTSEYEQLGGEEGYLRNQGFYVYRNHRLIIHGTWFRLAKFGEMSQLIRICVDIPNSLDQVWKINIDKSEAQLPTLLRNRLKQIVAGLRGRSSRVFRSKGGSIDNSETVSVWKRYVRHGEISYAINREHPIVAQLLNASDQKVRSAATAAIKAVEQGFPVSKFGADAVENVDAIHQTQASPKQFVAMLEAAIPSMLIAAGEDLQDMVDLLHKTEPFASNRVLVDRYLQEKGWFHG